MKAVTGQADEHIAGCYLFAREDMILFDDTNDRAGEIEIADGIHARHFRSLATDESAVVLFTGFCKSFDDIRTGIDIELATGKIIKEEDRPRTADEDVVDAMVDEVLPDS